MAIELEKQIEDAIITKIISLHTDFTANNVKSNREATSPQNYNMIADNEVLISYISDSLGTFKVVENKTLKKEIFQFILVFFNRSVPEENQEVLIKKNLIKNSMYAFKSVAGIVDVNPEVRIEIINERRLPYNKEVFPERDGFIWTLQTNELFKMI